MNHLKYVTYAIGGVVIFILLLAILLISASRSEAQDSGWLPRRWQKPQYHYRHPNSRIREPRRYYRSIEATSRETRCFGRVFSDKGREFSSEESALKDAERSWGALVREEPGEKWMDLKFAERYESRCQRSSTGESATAKITETLTGGSLGVLYRCRIWAEPCTAPKTQDGGKDR